ncbi:hypothetical protein FE257_003972 [Aspergillus nanangensis]|uniref:Uncharacterized protein n=1 Tax=Aspergillus nanangensis TaxID=2582783 RepID=A0AAD4GWB1_ASPNN|nr:hypothetical protein FE257_003972 [Aspergillus nanangensis]
MPVGFDNLPTEIILLIIHFLEYESEINALCRTSRNLHQRLNPILYEHNVRNGQSLGLGALEWAASNGRPQTARLALQAGAPPNASISEPCQPMVLAVYRGDEAIMQLLCDHGIDPVSAIDWRNPLAKDADQLDANVTPFITAVGCGHTSIVRSLLDAGVQPSYPASIHGHGYEPVYLAAREGHLATVQLLAEAGWRIDDPSSAGETPLATAAEGGHLAVVRYLVEQGARPEFPVRWGPRPLCWAAKAGHRDVVQFLLDHGVEHDPSMLYALSWAAENTHDEVVELLLDRVDYVRLAATDANQQAMLFCAVAESQCRSSNATSSFLTELLDTHGYDPNATPSDSRASGRYRWSALTRAASRGHVENVKVLLAHGANPSPALTDIIDQEFQPLPRAVKIGNEEIVTLLLDAGVDPNALSLLRRTLPFKAIPFPRIFKQLLDRGIDPETISPSGIALAGEVVAQGNVAVLRMLMDRGLQLENHMQISRRKRSSVLRQAILGGHEVLDFLLSEGWSPPLGDRMCIGLAAESGNVRMLQRLVELGFRVHDAEMAPTDLLFGAASATGEQADPEACVDFLLRHGLAVDAAFVEGGTTALFEAVFQCRMQAVRILLARRADPLWVNGEGISPLVVAMEPDWSPSVDEERDVVLGLLLQALEERQVSFAEMEAQLCLAIEKVEPEKRQRTKLLRQFYWRKRYPVCV